MAKKKKGPAVPEEKDLHPNLAKRINSLRQSLGGLIDATRELRSCPPSQDVEHALEALDNANKALDSAEKYLQTRYQRVSCETQTPYGEQGGVKEVTIQFGGVGIGLKADA